MAEEIILKVGVEGTGQGEQKIKSLKAQLKEMKNELLGMDEGSAAFQKLSREAGELEDKIGDVNQKVKALSSDTKKLDALVGVGSAIAGGFQAAQGAMALFGSNSKEVEKAIQNIIAVQGVLNGVQQVGQFLTSKGIVQDAIANGLIAIKTGLLSALTAAQWLWNAAMTANPIGLIIAGVAALVGGISLLIKYYEKLSSVLLAVFGIFDAGAMAAAEEHKQEQKRREERGKAHQERLNQIQKETDAKIEAADKTISALELEKETLEAQGKSSDAVTIKILEAEREKTRAVLEGNKEKIQSWIDYYKTEMALSGQSEDEFRAMMKGRGIDLELLQKKADDLILQNENNVQHSENAITKFKREQHEQRVKDHKTEVDEIEKLDRARIERLDNDNVIVKEKEKNKYDSIFELGVQANLAQKKLKEEQDAEDAERAARNLKTAEDFANATVNLTNTVFTLTNALGKQDEQHKEKRAKRQFEISKALQLGLAVIDGYKAVTTSLALSPVAIGPVPNPAGIASLAFAVTTSLANIAKIAASKYNGGGGASLSVGSADIGSATANVGNTTPNINGIQSGSTLLNQPPQKVVVVESDITKVQKKINVIEAANTFG